MTRQFIATTEINGKVYKTREWVLWSEDGTPLERHREYYGQFVTDSLKNVVKSRFNVEKLREAYKNGDIYFNDCTAMVQWDRLSEIAKHSSGKLMTSVNHPDKKGVIYWSLSDGVCVMKEAARLICAEEQKMAWNVYLKGKLIDTVFYDKTCDAEYVRNGLINHDGYDQRIIVKKAK